jgi:DNA-binding HxlR family transcriptional regulator
MDSSSNGELCLCALDGVMEVLSRKWVLFTINSIGRRGVARFKDLYRELKGISPSTLTAVLRGLEAQGLVSRQQYAEIPPRVEYSLTKDGEALRRAILPLLIWASERDTRQNSRPRCEPGQYVRVV